MKIALPPWGIARLEFGLEPRRNGARMHFVHIADVKNRPAPPAKHAGPGDDIEETSTRMEAGQPRIRATMGHFEPQRGVERNRRPHVTGRQRHRAEGFDFGVCRQATFSGLPVAADLMTASITAMPWMTSASGTG